MLEIEQAERICQFIFYSRLSKGDILPDKFAFLQGRKFFRKGAAGRESAFYPQLLARQTYPFAGKRDDNSLEFLGVCKLRGEQSVKLAFKGCIFVI